MRGSLQRSEKDPVVHGCYSALQAILVSNLFKSKSAHPSIFTQGFIGRKKMASRRTGLVDGNISASTSPTHKQVDPYLPTNLWYEARLGYGTPEF